MPRLVMGPFNRVEGDLEVTLDVADGAVRAAHVNSPLHRGIETILVGRPPTDALVYAPRICGICSVSQSMAASLALRALAGGTPPPNGTLCANLTLAIENLADHLSHFYLFFMPDFVRPVYASRPWHARVAARFRAVHGEASVEALAARGRLLECMGVLAGRWPHTLAIQPGGSTRAISAAEKIRLGTLLLECRRFLERVLFAEPLEAVVALSGEAALSAWRGERPRGDFGLFLDIADDLSLHALGRATDAFLSYGSFPGDDGPWLPRGVWQGAPRPMDPSAITEDVSHAWLEGATAHPSEGMTRPNADKASGYTWCKAPRLDGQVVEAGALARQVVDGLPLIRDAVGRTGGNVRNRVVARIVECARLTMAMEAWVRALRPADAFHEAVALPDEGRAFGLTESARGSLGHWIDVAGGRIRNYQIVSPTTWNFSPRDAAGTPGALEQALVGTPVPPDDPVPVAVQHVVRSFDPCMVCTVH
ncbi:MAG: nickel-dependent hydrogenase large subunit [Burkholderiales bacterium]